MLKIILSAVIVGICGYVGIQINSEYNKKLSFFNDFTMFLQYIMVKIAFFQNRFSDCINEFLLSNKPKNKFFEKLLLVSKTQNFNIDEIHNQIDLNILESEKLFVAKSIFNISSCNIENVEKYINGCITENQMNINKYNNLCKSKGILFKKISVYIGIAICILLY